MVMGELPERTDVVVIGGGPGGYSAAFRAADLGLDVTLVSDEERLGGVCLLRGCIPSKALLDTVEVITRAGELTDRGVDYDEPSIDTRRLADWTSGVVDSLAGGLTSIAEARGVTLVRGRARFEGSGEVRVTGDEGTSTIGFDHAVIATGSRPSPLPDVEFGDTVMDSTGALDVADVGGSLLVVGGGYVGLELGTVHAALGTAVTVVEMTDRLLPGVDADLVTPLRRRLDGLFAGIHVSTTVESISTTDGGVEIEFSGDDPPDTTSYDRVLVAIGRQPNTDDLGIDATSAEVDEHGRIVVDDRRRTNDPRIHAVGDAVGGAMLAHEAIHEGIVAAESIAGEPASFDARAVPAVVYTDPQIAWCGLTETAASEQGRSVTVTTVPWKSSGRARAMESGDGSTKLVTDPESGRVLGVGIVGRHAESLIAEGVLAVEMGAVATDIALTIHPHPTVSETIHEAAAKLLGHPVHLPPDDGHD